MYNSNQFTNIENLWKNVCDRNVNSPKAKDFKFTVTFDPTKNTGGPHMLTNPWLIH